MPGSIFLITFIPQDTPVAVIDLSLYNTVEEDEDPKRKHFITISQSEDDTVEKWSFSASKDVLDKWVATIKGKFVPKAKSSPSLPSDSASPKTPKKKSKGSTHKKRKVDELDDDAKGTA